MWICKYTNVKIKHTNVKIKYPNVKVKYCTNVKIKYMNVNIKYYTNVKIKYTNVKITPEAGMMSQISAGWFGFLKDLLFTGNKINRFSSSLNRSFSVAQLKHGVQRGQTVPCQHCHPKCGLWQEPQAPGFWRVRCQGLCQVGPGEQRAHRQVVPACSWGWVLGIAWLLPAPGAQQGSTAEIPPLSFRRETPRTLLASIFSWEVRGNGEVLGLWMWFVNISAGISVQKQSWRCHRTKQSPGLGAGGQDNNLGRILSFSAATTSFLGWSFPTLASAQRILLEKSLLWESHSLLVL